MKLEGGWRGAFGRLFDLLAILGIWGLFVTMLIVYYKISVDSWFVGVTTVVGYVVVDLIARNAIEEKEGHFYIPLIGASLHPRQRLFFILFLVMLFGSLGAAVIASLVIVVPAFLSGGQYTGWVGSFIVIAFVYLDYWTVYTRKEGKRASLRSEPLPSGQGSA